MDASVSLPHKHPNLKPKTTRASAFGLSFRNLCAKEKKNVWGPNSESHSQPRFDSARQPVFVLNEGLGFKNSTYIVRLSLNQAPIRHVFLTAGPLVSVVVFLVAVFIIVVFFALALFIFVFFSSWVGRYDLSASHRQPSRTQACSISPHRHFEFQRNLRLRECTVESDLQLHPVTI